MQINFTGQSIQVTPAIRDYTTQKFDKLKHRGDKIISVHVVFDVEKLQQIAKATIHVPGKEIHASSESTDLYSAIDLLVDKLDQQIIKHKDKMKDHHDQHDQYEEHEERDL